MFWPSFFGATLTVLAVAAPLLVWRRVNAATRSRPRRRAELLLSLLPGAFLFACFGITECRQAILVERMSRIDQEWSASQVTLLLGPPDHVFEPGDLHPRRSYGSTNPTPVWSYTPPRARGWMRMTGEFPYIRFRSGLDGLADVFVGGIFGIREGAFILQMGSDGRVIRKGSWE